MTFNWRHGPSIAGYATYVAHEYSINFVPDIPIDRDSFDAEVSLDTLTLLVRRSDGRVAFPEGYFPKASWTEQPLAPPRAERGQLYWEQRASLVRGASVEATETALTKFYDPDSSWLKIATAEAGTGHLQVVEFCGGVLAELDESKLVALWINLT